MKTFNTFPLFRSQGRLLTRWKSFFVAAGNQNHLRSLAVLLVKQVNKKQRSLVSSCLGGMGIVVENLHVKEIKSLSRKKPLWLLFNHTLPHHSIYPLTRPESGLIIYIYTSMYKYISTVRVSLRYESLFLDEGQRL